MQVPIISSEQYWACPNCNQRSMTTEASPHTRFHTCAGLKGLTAPFIPVDQCGNGRRGTRVIAVEREDYVGKEDVHVDSDGKAIMSVITERSDGSQDVAVLAPTANVSFGIQLS